MTEVFIKYNPYMLETEVKIDGEPVAQDSALFIEDGKRLQEWIEELPDKIKRVCNEREASVTFYGTTSDFDDLQSVAEAAKEEGVFLDCKHEQSRETEDKISVIKQIFEDIKRCPYSEFAELTEDKVCELFEDACDTYFPIQVVATMSAGKSTLINALLGYKLMPSKNEACTATITKITDCAIDTFRANVYDKNDVFLKGPIEPLTYQDMQRLNDTPDVSKIEVEGNIPFVSSKEMSLVLVDSPGTNNSLVRGHHDITFEALKSPMTLVLYILNATQIATDDDSGLLDEVIDEIKKGGKLSRDRFIFVVNKLDAFDAEDDNVRDTLAKVRKYLEGKGVKDPNVFPATALTALNIRTLLKDQKVEADNIDFNVKDVNTKKVLLNIQILNDPEGQFHLEDYAHLTPSLRKEIDSALERARNENDAKAEALIHTGIIPIEAAIRTYVEKYAKTAKIKRLVDAFYPKLKSTVAIEDLKREILTNEESARRIQENIDAINAKLRSGDEAKRFKERVARISYTDEIERLSNAINNKAQAEITSTIELSREKLTIAQANDEHRRLSLFAKDLQAKVKVDIEKAITEHVNRNAKSLLDEYKRSLSELVQDLKVTEVVVNPLSLMAGSIDVDGQTIINELKKTERVKTGTHREENTNKKWWKFWTWFDPDYYDVDDYVNRDYVEGKRFAQEFLAPLQKGLYTNVEKAKSKAKEMAEAVKRGFSREFDQLNELLKKKMDELKACEDDKRNKERAIVAAKEALERQTWLEGIRNRVEKILEV